MIRLMLLLGFLVPKIWGTPDLVVPFYVDLKSATNPYWDTVVVSTFFSNQGNTTTNVKTFDWTAFQIVLDSFPTGGLHNVPANLAINPGVFQPWKDTIIAPKGPFSITTWCDPLLFSGEGGYQIANNVRSQAYNFHPTIQQIHDTTVVYDTLRFHDTLKVVEKDTVSITLHDTTRVSVTDTIFQRDTVRVVVRDTIIKRDTIRVGPPTLAKAASLAYAAPVASVVYNAAGAKVWEGMLPPGAYPPAGLRPGLHLIVQGNQARRFRIAYR